MNIYPKNFEQKLGFDHIRQLIIGYCISDLGIQKTNDMAFSSNHELIIKLLFQTYEMKIILEGDSDFQLKHFHDVTPALKEIRIEGTYLEINNLYELKKSLEAATSVLRFFKNTNDEQFPHLRELAGDVIVHKYVTERIDAILNKHGKIRDNASPELAGIRRMIINKKAGLSKKLNSILGHIQKNKWVDSGLSVTKVNGRTVIPIDSTHKRKIKGLIHDESATGKTSYIEPTEIVESNNEIRELENEERREILRILRIFADDIRPYIDDLIFAFDFLGEIDFINAKAKLAVRIKAEMPTLLAERLIDWKEARHPLLQIAFEKENRKVVPLNLQLDNNERIIIISGPNAGGKSVCLKTSGLVQYMVQCGLLVPMHKESKMGIFSKIFIDIGDEQSIENDLSTYSSHLINMKYFLKESQNETLILIDEFGTGTEPHIGGVIAETILDNLCDSDCFGVITTHYTNLKHFAVAKEGVINGAMLFDTGKMQPLFKLDSGKPGSSFAFEIAKKIGLPDTILQQATSKIGQDHVDFDKHLKDALRDKRYWENKRQKIRQNEKKLEETLEKYIDELSQTRKMRKQILTEAESEAELILSGANKKIENTIRQIKEANAEKEKTKKAREQLDKYKEQIEDENLRNDNASEKKIKKLREKEEQVKISLGIEIEKPVVQIDSTLHIGDKVKITDQDTIGEVMDIMEKTVLVAFGNMMTSIKKDKLVKISNNEFKKQNKDQVYSSNIADELYQRKINFRSQIDLRGKKAEEALMIIESYIDEAIMVNTSEVRILHGKGYGILRKLIREYLRKVDLVESINDEQIEFGGDGITIVKFKK